MIVFGTRAKTLATQPLQHTCGSCGTYDQTVHVFQRYFHVFWIPIFALTKTSVTECRHCKKTLKKKEFPVDLRPVISRIQTGTKTPVWLFTGLILFSLLFVFSLYSVRNEALATQEYLANPSTGDLAVLQIENEYRVLKVSKIENQSVQIQFAQYAYRSLTGAKKEAKKNSNVSGYFFDESHQMPIDEYRTSPIELIIRN